MIPPRIDAFEASLVPNLFPIIRPAKHMIKVTTPMITAQTNADKNPYSAIVKPTESASIEVGMPCKIIILNFCFFVSASSSLSALLTQCVI